MCESRKAAMFWTCCMYKLTDTQSTQDSVSLSHCVCVCVCKMNRCVYGAVPAWIVRGQYRASYTVLIYYSEQRTRASSETREAKNIFSNFCVTHSEERAIYPLLHTWAHRWTWLARVTVSDWRERERECMPVHPPTYQGLNSRSVSNRQKALKRNTSVCFCLCPRIATWHHSTVYKLLWKQSCKGTQVRNISDWSVMQL